MWILWKALSDRSFWWMLQHLLISYSWRIFLPTFKFYSSIFIVIYDHSIVVILLIIWLTHFKPKLHFYTPWKRKKTFSLLTFSEGIEMQHWLEMIEAASSVGPSFKPVNYCLFCLGFWRRPIYAEFLSKCYSYGQWSLYFKIEHFVWNLVHGHYLITLCPK